MPLYENIAGFTVGPPAQGLSKLTTPYSASADTAGKIVGDGWFSFKYNPTNQGVGIVVSLRDATNRYSIVNQQTSVEVRVNGAYRANFAKDLSKTLRIERSGGIIRILEATVVRWTSQAGASTTPADFTISCGGDSSAAGMGISSVSMSSLAPIPVDIVGRIVTQSNRGLSSVTVRTVDSQGQPRLAKTNPYGYFRFLGMSVGTYTFAFLAKEKADASYVFVDGLGIGDIGHVVLRDRQMLAQDGMLAVTAVIESKTKKVLGNIQITSRGFIHVKENFDLVNDIKRKVHDLIKKNTSRDTSLDWELVRNQIREQVGQFVFTKTARRPMVLPVVVEV